MSTAIPRATYRLQLHAGFTFADATALVPYLAQLGISHVYCSPIFRARPGSLHGYDIVDHNAVNPEIGTRAELEDFVATLRAHDMGCLLDFVPNHVGVMGEDNAWWLDVLENGRASAYAGFFDIDWSPPNAALAGKLLVPVLGDPYGSVLERGELRLACDADRGSFAVHYYQHCLPLDPRSYPMVLVRAIGALDGHAPLRSELEQLASAFGQLPDRDGDPSQHARRRDDQLTCQQRLAALLASHAPLRDAVDKTLAALNGTPGEAASFDPLHALLEQQCYRLAYWRVAIDDINYRRFFDVNSLAALRMEDDAVFDATHGLLLELIGKGLVDGVRIDHSDGLYDPRHYFAKLQQRAAQALGGDAGDRRPLYLLVEKITASFERLPVDWAVHGTTGYHFANVVNGLFVDARARSRMSRLYHNFIGEQPDWAEVARDGKVLVMRSLLAAETHVLANQLARIAQANRHTRDFTLDRLQEVLIEVIAFFPVYRTYVTDTASDEDRRYIDWAIARTRKRGATGSAPLLDFVRNMMLADATGWPQAMHAEIRAFAHKVQQATAPVTAKGVEDTALYRYTRLAALNEVGGEPGNFGISVRQFHSDARQRARHWPHEMLTTSTHDTKRGEDVRARIDVLSELPALWRRSLQRWSRLNRGRRRLVDEQWAPGRRAEYLLYQTLLGTWPLEPQDAAGHETYRERIADYMIKAMREAKLRTSWTNVNDEYEEALRQFVAQVLEQREGNAFVAELDTLARRMARHGFLNSLGQVLAKLTAPGMPDIYQGNELWDWSLVDPDNRRPVDYALRRWRLGEVTDWTAGDAGALQERLREVAALLQQGREDGRAKLHVTRAALQLRREHAALFRDGKYLPLRVLGEHAAHLVAFARVHEDEVAITVFVRLSARLVGARENLPLGENMWGDTRVELPARLARSAYHSVLDAQRLAPAAGELPVLPAAQLLAHWPCALLYAGAPD